MRRFIVSLSLALAAVLATAIVAFAGSPHFVFVDVSSSGNTLTVTGKEAGLGDESQVHIVVTADALCINGGGNHPKAVNKTSVTTAADVPVQNGKADFTLMATAVFQPDCAPPMTVQFQNVVVTDTTNGVTFP